MRPPSRHRAGADDGMVTAELATALPVLVLVLLAVLAAIDVEWRRVQVQDAAREAVRAAARGDESSARSAVEQIAPHGELSLNKRGTLVTATVQAEVHPVGVPWASVSVTAEAVAAREPDADFGSLPGQAP